MKRKLSFYFPFLLFFLLLLASCKETTVADSPQKVNSHKGYDYRKKADLFVNETRPDSAYYYYNLSKDDFLQHSDSLNVVYNLLIMAQIQKLSGDYYGCESTISEALPFLKSTDTTYLPEAYNVLGMCHQELFNYTKAIDYFSQAINLTNDSLNKAIYTNNRAVVYNLTSEYDVAKNEFETLMKKQVVLNNKETKARVLDNYGFTLLKKQDSKALDYLKEGLKIRTAIQDHNGLITSFFNLGTLYNGKDKNKARFFALNALTETQIINNPDDQLVVLKLLYQIDQDQKYLEEYIKLNDSLNKNRQIAKNQFAAIKYDFFKKNQELLELETENSERALLLEKIKNRNLILWFAISFTALIASYYLYRLNNKRKRQILQQSYLTETRIAKQIHDELANDVFNAMTFTQTQNLENPNVKETLLDNLELIYHRTRDISKENNDINTDAAFETDLFQMIDSYGNEELNVIKKISADMQWLKISAEKKIALFRVIQELLINTKKHSKATLVIIDFSEQKKGIYITYTDNGIGLKNAQKSKSGLQNAENRILAIKGSFTFDTSIQKGFKTTVFIPK
jgi:signal transduction histidine kinase